MNSREFMRAESVSSHIVSIVMLIVAAMLAFLIIEKINRNPLHGNVLLGMLMAAGDLFVNSIFFYRFVKLSKILSSSIISSQKSFYTMKVLSNSTVLLSLILILFSNNAAFDKTVDTIASVLLILICIVIAIRNLIENRRIGSMANPG
jgi:divalent metal cation (Fe/Co/Zn/Cd) transporter